MRVYLATKFENLSEFWEVADALKGAGHVLSHDWTSESVPAGSTAAQAEEHLQSCGAKDFRGVRLADALVLINRPDLRDAMTEFGIALGRGTPVYVLNPERKTSVFFHRATMCWGVGDLIRKLAQQKTRMEDVSHVAL